MQINNLDKYCYRDLNKNKLTSLVNVIILHFISYLEFFRNVLLIKTLYKVIEINKIEKKFYNDNNYNFSFINFKNKVKKETINQFNNRENHNTYFYYNEDFCKKCGKLIELTNFSIIKDIKKSFLKNCNKCNYINFLIYENKKKYYLYSFNYLLENKLITNKKYRFLINISMIRDIKKLSKKTERIFKKYYYIILRIKKFDKIRLAYKINLAPLKNLNKIKYLFEINKQIFYKNNITKD